MGRDPTKCRECGARVKDEDGAFCRYCGAKLPESGQAAAPGPLGDIERRLDELKSRPEVAGLMKRRPSTSRHSARIAAQGVFFLLFGGFAIFFDGGPGREEPL